MYYSLNLFSENHDGVNVFKVINFTERETFTK